MLDEDNAKFEMEIKDNGPLLIHADRILKNAMDKYWSNTESRKQHFVSKASDDLKTTSKVIARLKKKVQIKFSGDLKIKG